MQSASACPDGFYGHNCSRLCGECLGDDVCDKTTGTCPRGCATGWTENFCNKGQSKMIFTFRERKLYKLGSRSKTVVWF